MDAYTIKAARLVRPKHGMWWECRFDTLHPETNHAVLIYGWEGGTGRFTNATGTTVWQVDIKTDQTYDAVADGVIDY